MARSMRPQNRAEQNAANENRWRTADMSTPTLSDSDRYYSIFSEQASKTLKYAAGYGSKNKEVAEGFADLDLKDDSTTPVDITGTARWALYSDATLEDPIAFSGTIDLSDLRESVSESRRQKRLLNGLAPIGNDDRVLVFEVSPDTSSEGVTVSSGNSNVSVGIPYSQFRMQG